MFSLPFAKKVLVVFGTMLFVCLCLGSLAAGAFMPLGFHDMTGGQRIVLFLYGGVLQGALAGGIGYLLDRELMSAQAWNEESETPPPRVTAGGICGGFGLTVQLVTLLVMMFRPR